MKEVLLIHPPVYYSKGRPRIMEHGSPPLGLMDMVSYAHKVQNSFNFRIVDVAAEKLTIEQLKALVSSVKPFAAGISIITPQLQGAYETAAAIRGVLPAGAKIFAGGTHISADPDFVKRNPGLIDYAIKEEAEKTFVECLQKLEKEEELPQIIQGEALKDLDEIPVPDDSLINLNNYRRIHYMQNSRSCPFKCYFCSSPAMSAEMRYKSIDRVMSEIRAFYPRYKGRITFYDENFTLKKDRALALCHALKKDGSRFSWFAFARIDAVDEEIIKAMKEGGCDLAAFGIESADEKLRRDVIQKGSFTNDQIFQVREWCKNAKLKFGAYFMLGNPTETEAIVRAGRKMIFDLDLDALAMSIPIPYPGSRLYEIAKEEGIINEEIIDRFAKKELGEGYGGVYPVYIPKTLDPEFLFRQMQEINKKFYLNLKTFWTKLKEHIFYPDDLLIDARYLYYLITTGSSYRRPYIGFVNKKKDD